MEWLDLVAPSAAILALFAAVGLVVQSIRQGRAIRRLEDRLAQGGGASVEAPLERVQQLQARAAVSSGEGPRISRGTIRTALVAAAVVSGVALTGAGAWFALSRGGDDGDAADGPVATLEEDVAMPTVPADPGTVPEEPVPVSNPQRFEVAVFNGSGVTGAAAEAGQRLTTEGWQVPDALIGDEPNGRTDVATTVVQWNGDAQAAAVAVAQDLDVDDASPLDGYTPEQIGGADVLVVIGEDLAAASTP